jgi:hypothetical protein
MKGVKNEKSIRYFLMILLPTLVEAKNIPKLLPELFYLHGTQ